MNIETSYHRGTYYIIVGDDEDYTSTITSALTYDTSDSINVFWIYNNSLTIDDLKKYLDEILIHLEYRQDSINGILDSCYHDRKLHNQINRKPFKRMRRKAIFHYGRTTPGIRKD